MKGRIYAFSSSTRRQHERSLFRDALARTANARHGTIPRASFPPPHARKAPPERGGRQRRAGPSTKTCGRRFPRNKKSCSAKLAYPSHDDKKKQIIDTFAPNVFGFPLLQRAGHGVRRTSGAGRNQRSSRPGPAPRVHPQPTAPHARRRPNLRGQNCCDFLLPRTGSGACLYDAGERPTSSPAPHVARVSHCIRGKRATPYAHARRDRPNLCATPDPGNVCRRWTRTCWARGKKSNARPPLELMRDPCRAANPAA